MKQFKRVLTLVLAAALVLSFVLTPQGGAVTASAASGQTVSGQAIHPFSGSEALVRDTIEELRALGKTKEEKEDDPVLVASVERASGMSYQEVRSFLYAGLTENYDSGKVDVAALGLTKEQLSAVVADLLGDNYMSVAYSGLTYATVGGKATELGFKVSEGYSSAMAAIAAELPEINADIGQKVELALEADTAVFSSRVNAARPMAEGDDEEATCTHHTVAGNTVGDFNEDGEITIADVQTFRNLYANDELSSGKVGDFNEDGEITIADVQTFRNMYANDEVVLTDPEMTFIWNEEPVKDSTPITDEDGNTLNGGLLYDHETGEVSQGIVPNVYYELVGVSFDCAVCGQHIEITNETEEGAQALADMSSAKDVWINVVTYETVTCDAGTDPVLPEGEEDDYMLYTEMQVAVYTDDSFSVDENYNPVTDEEGNVIGLFSDSMDNGDAEVKYFYSILSSFINDKAEYFGTPTDFWTSKNSESNPMAALKYVCNVDPETQVPPAQMLLMVRDMPQAFMAFYYQYGNELVAMRNAAIDAMPDGLTDVQKLLFLHDWLAENAVFDMGAMTSKDENGNPKSDPIQMTTFGALLSNQLRDSYNGVDGSGDGYYGGLCPSYAAAYCLLVQAANPDVYQTTETDEDGNETTRWATVAEVDERGGDLVDFIQVLFLVDTAEASLAGEGFGGGWFNNVHYFNAVKLASPAPGEGTDEDGNAWYYVDSCYDDIYIECLAQYRGESDGSVNHTYFMLSPQTMATLYGDNVERIDSLYDGYTYQQTDEKYEEGDDKYNPDDPDHLKYEKVENPDEFAYDDTSFEDSWFSGVVSKVYWDDNYFYYVDGGSSAASYADMMDQMDEMGSDSDQDVSMADVMHGNRVNVEDQDLLKRRPRTSPDYWEDESQDDSSMSMFGGSSKEDTYAEVLLDYGTGEMNGEVVLADEVVEDFVFNEQYPALTHTVALYDGKLYFNLSNDIYVCGIDGSGVQLFMEYNEVKYSSDGRPFTATSYTVDSNGDKTVTNKPIGAICVHTTYTPQYQEMEYEGQTVNVFTGLATADTMTVNIATNYSFTSAGTDVEDEKRYTVEAVNFNPDYQLYGSEEVENDNEEFMWCAVIRDELDIASLVTETDGSTVNVAATCTRPAYTDTRTASGVILSREKVDGSVPTGHSYVYDGDVETEDGVVEGEHVYLCEHCDLQATVKVEDTENGTVTLYATSSNGLDGVTISEEDTEGVEGAEGFAGMELGEEITPVSPAREAETKTTGQIEIIPEPAEGFLVSKVEYAAAGSTEYTEIPLTIPEATEEDEDSEEAEEPQEPKYLLDKEEGCISIRVTFIQGYELTVEQSDGGSVSVVGIAPEEAGEDEEVDENVTTYLVAEGDTVELSVVPEEGYVLGELTVMNGETALDVAEPEEEGAAYTHSFTMPAGEVTVTATFLKQSGVVIKSSDVGTLTVTVGETEITTGDSIDEGETVTIVAVPNEGYSADPTVTYEVETVDDNGETATETKPVDVTPVEGKENTYTFTMPAYDVTIDGGFTAIDYKVNVTQPEKGGTTVVSAETAHVGDEVTITVTPDENYTAGTPTVAYEVEVVNEDGTTSKNPKSVEVTLVEGEDNTYTFTMPAADVEVTVTFTEKAYTITLNKPENGSADVDKTTAVAGETVTITVAPADGYVTAKVTFFDGTIEEEAVLTDTDDDGNEVYTFEMPSSDVEVTVTFEPVSEPESEPEPEPELPIVPENT